MRLPWGGLLRPESESGAITPAAPGKFAIAKKAAPGGISLTQEGKRWIAKAPDGTVLYSGLNKDWVELRGKEEFEEWQQKQKDNPYFRQPILTGYRGVMPEGSYSFGSTEGNGIYLGKTPADAEFFSQEGKTKKFTYRKPLNPLIVDEEPLFILNEDPEIMEPIKKGDSKWTRFNKQARINAGVTNENWGKKQDALTAELTRLILDAGYDAVDITTMGQSWVVLLKPELMTASGFTKNQRYASATPSSTPAALTASFKALADDATVQALVDRGRLKIVARQRNLPDSIVIPPGQRVAGAVDPKTGKVYLIAENIAPGEVQNLTEHEKVHDLRLGLDQPRTGAMKLARFVTQAVGLRGILGETTFNDVLAQVERMREAVRQRFR